MKVQTDVKAGFGLCSSSIDLDVDLLLGGGCGCSRTPASAGRNLR